MARIAILTVAVALDPVPGTFHQPEDFQRHIQRMLDDAMPHYHPVVQVEHSKDAYGGRTVCTCGDFNCASLDVPTMEG